MPSRRRPALLLVLLAAACGADARDAPTPVARDTSRSGAPDARPDGDAAPGARSDPRPRVDTRARLDLTGVPEAIAVEIDGEELSGIVLLPPGRRTLHVYGEGLPLGEREIELHSGRTTVPDLGWAPEALEKVRAHYDRHPWHRTERVTEPALDWLAVHRTPEGIWSAARFPDRCPDDARCDGAVDDVADPEATGLALLAFLGAGETHEVGPERRVVRDAFDALVRRQDAAGRFDADPRAHAVATLALTELCGHTDTRRFRDPAQAAVDALVAMRRPGRGWSRAGAPDPEATAWGAFAVTSARSAALTVPEALSDDLLLDLTIFGDPGGTQIDDRAGALLTLARLVLGAPADDPAVASGLARILAKPPPAGEPVDTAALWAGTAVVFRAGGRDAWRRWDAAVQAAVVTPLEERREVFGHGRADAHGRAFGSLGRVRWTACVALVRGVVYRFSRVFGVTDR